MIRFLAAVALSTLALHAAVAAEITGRAEVGDGDTLDLVTPETRVWIRDVNAIDATDARH
jgi:hypothetical protein